jgi:hypothetical protein
MCDGEIERRIGGNEVAEGIDGVGDGENERANGNLETRERKEEQTITRKR